MYSLSYQRQRTNLNMKSDHRSKFSNLSNWNEEAWKKSGLQRGAMLYQLSYEQGIWQDALVRICIICLLPHPLHSWGIFPHKTRKLLHIGKKATAYHPQKQKLNNNEFHHFEKLFTQNSDQNTLFLFANNFKPPGIPCTFCWWAWVLVFGLPVFSFPCPI